MGLDLLAYYLIFEDSVEDHFVPDMDLSRIQRHLGLLGDSRVHQPHGLPYLP